MLIMYANRINVFLCFMCVSYLHVSCVNLSYISNAIVKHNCVHKIEGVIKFLATLRGRLVDKVWETLL